MLIYDQGPRTPGLFRIPGQVSVVNKLYDHYVAQVRCAIRERQEVQSAFGHAALPVTLAYDVHDVASVFKKFLWDIPGGILGSIRLFKLLQSLQCCENNEEIWRTARPRLVALAFLSMRSATRLSLTAAVFGLLAVVKNDRIDSSSVLGEHKMMSSQAFAIVFAPILLGNLTGEIDVFSSSATGSVAARTSKRSFFTHLKTPKKGNPANLSKVPELSRGLARSNATAAVIEMLLQDWEAIAYHMKFPASTDKRR